MEYFPLVAAGLILIVFAGLDSISPWFAVIGVLVMLAPLAFFAYRQRQLGSEKYAVTENQSLHENKHRESEEYLRRVIDDGGSASE